MRVIKFRVWLPKARRSAWSGNNPPDRRKFGRMIEFDELHFSISDDSLQHPQILTNTSEHFYGEDIYKSQEGAILMQYIGLCDTNGIEIYEGDIVRWLVATNEELDGIENWQIQEVTWIGPRLSINTPGNDDYQDLWQIEPWELEVIGNIYETPKLLKP